MHIYSGTSFLRASSASFLLFGIVMILSAHGELYLPQLPAQLGEFTEVQTPYSGGAQMDVAHRSAPPEAAVVAMAEKQLALGMLIVVVGFFTHILFRYRHGAKTATTRTKLKVRPAFSMK